MSHWGKNISSEGRVLLFCFPWIFSIMDRLSTQSWLTTNGWVSEWMNGRTTVTAPPCSYTQLCSRFTESTVYATVRLSGLRFTYWDLVSIIQCGCCWYFPKSTKLSTTNSYIWDRFYLSSERLDSFVCSISALISSLLGRGRLKFSTAGDQEVMRANLWVILFCSVFVCSLLFTSAIWRWCC